MSHIKYISDDEIEILHSDGSPCISLKLEPDDGEQRVLGLKDVCGFYTGIRLGRHSNKTKAFLEALQTFENTGNFNLYKGIGE